jgi:hypothetical protein
MFGLVGGCYARKVLLLAGDKNKTGDKVIEKLFPTN